MKKITLSLLISLATVFTLWAQNVRTEDSTLVVLEDTLNVLSYSIVNDAEANTRFASCNIFIKKLVSGLKRKHSFDYPFDRLSTISILYPPDSSFRIFTWQLMVDATNFRHYGAIQMRSDDLQLFPLIDRSFELEGSVDTIITNNEHWFGAIYYNIIPSPTTSDHPHYLLFGLDGYNGKNRRKIIEVLHFENGQPKFGKGVFIDEYDPSFSKKTRIVVEYAADAATRVNYDEELNMVIHDHIIQVDGKPLPDGSYVGFQYQENKWTRIDKVFNQRSTVPPGLERPKPNREQYDIFGKKINKN